MRKRFAEVSNILTFTPFGAFFFMRPRFFAAFGSRARYYE